MIETKTRTIDGLVVQLSGLPAMRALRMFTRLGRLLTPSLSQAVSQIDLTKGTKGLGSEDIASIGKALTSVFESATEAEVEAITRELLSSCLVDNLPLFPAVFDQVMAGKIDTVLKILLFAVEVNYGSFFAVFRGLGGPPATVKPSESTSPPASLTSGSAIA